MTDSTTAINKILTENDRRNEIMFAPCDYLTGEGSIGERVRVTVSDFVLPVQWLPVDMMNIQIGRASCRERVCLYV